MDISGYDAFTKIEPIAKGWSDDRKYYVEAADGRRMLLRVSDISELERKRAEYGMMERVYGIGVLTPEPLGFGLCDGGNSCYSGEVTDLYRGVTSGSGTVTELAVGIEAPGVDVAVCAEG